MNRLFKGLAALVVLGVLAAPVDAQMVPGTWYTFSWDIAQSTKVFPEFLVGGASAMDIQVVDCCIIGDRFEVFGSTSGFLGETSEILTGDGDPGSYDGDGAWAHPELSKGQYQVMGGETVSMYVTRQAKLDDGVWMTGQGYIRVVTPEPATLLLMATGLLGLGVVMRRREED